MNWSIKWNEPIKLTIAQFLTSIILDAKHDQFVRNNQYFFFHLHPKVSAYCSLKVSDANGKKIGCTQHFFPVLGCFASKIIDVRN